MTASSPANPPVIDSIEQINELASTEVDGIPRLIVHRRCRRLLDGLQLVKRGPDQILDNLAAQQRLRRRVQGVERGLIESPLADLPREPTFEQHIERQAQKQLKAVPQHLAEMLESQP